MQVVHVEANRRAVRGAREPEVKVLAALAGFEEEDDVAGMEVCERVEEEVVSGLLLLAVELCLFVGVGEEAGEICQKMSVAFVVSFFFFLLPLTVKKTYRYVTPREVNIKTRVLGIIPEASCFCAELKVCPSSCSSSSSSSSSLVVSSASSMKSSISRSSESSSASARRAFFFETVL